MLGLALEGGGAKGAFQMGAVKAFLDTGYIFNGVAGTSIGALNGAMIAQGDFELGYKCWERLDSSLLFDAEPAQIEKYMKKRSSKAALQFWASVIKEMIENGGLDTTKIRDFLHLVINEEKLRQSNIDLGIVTVSVSDLKALELFKEDIPEGKMIDYLMASANFPVFRPEPIEGKYYIDGGFYDNLPINLLINKGYKDIIAIRTFGPGRIRKVKDEQVQIINISPSMDLGSLLIFDNDLIKENLKMGYCDAMREIKGLRGKKYYIHSVDDDSVFWSLASIPEKVILEIAEFMELPKMEHKKLLFEKIIPELSLLLELPVSAGYQDVVIGALEQVAETREIEKYTVRSLGGFLRELKKSKNLKPDIEDSLRSQRKQSKTAVLDKVGDEFIKAFKL